MKEENILLLPLFNIIESVMVYPFWKGQQKAKLPSVENLNVFIDQDCILSLNESIANINSYEDLYPIPYSASKTPSLYWTID